ncbi:MAG: GIY-YIG nuclease family protein [Pseudomonadales bacterium]|nr:GIY-YIG nuclease family protein [Pseudomonadales bacterium]
MSGAQPEFVDSCIDKSPGTSSGTYAVIFSCPKVNENKVCQIGRLGEVRLKQGYYRYVGSAFGPGGLKARLAHHRRTAKKPHWHLDYLKPYLQIEQIWFTRDPLRREHLWALTMAGEPASKVPFIGFGSSDCECPTHLIYSTKKPELEGFWERVDRQTDNHQPIHLAAGIGEFSGLIT